MQLEGGFLGGLFLGLVPFAGVGQQLLDVTGVLPKGTPEARLGLALGQIVGGAFTAASGAVAAVGGGAVSLTGLGALIGVPVVVGSATAVVGGIGNMAAGVRGLMTTGSGGGKQQGVTGAKQGPPNPYGKKGGPAHQEKVGEVAADVESRGLEAGFEHKVETPGGAKGSRFVDVVGRDAQGNIVEMHQIGRQTKGGAPVTREVRALNDIERATGTPPRFHPYK